MTLSDIGVLTAGASAPQVRHHRAVDETMLSQSLDELENDEWPASDDDATRLVQEVHRLRSVPIGSMTVEDLRLMLGQQIGTEWLMLLALERLTLDPLAEGDFYPGDLLMSVLRTDRSYWSTHPGALKALQEVRLQLVESRSGVIHCTLCDYASTMSRPDDPKFTVDYEHWLNREFPKGSPTDSVDELKGDLVLVDYYVADTVIPFHEGRAWAPGAVDVAQAIADLEQRIEAAMPAARQSDRDLLELYRDYCADLRRVWASATRAVESQVR